MSCIERPKVLCKQLFMHDYMQPASQRHSTYLGSRGKVSRYLTFFFKLNNLALFYYFGGNQVLLSVSIERIRS